MFKFKHRSLIFLGGSVWLLIGITLLSLGVNFLLEALKSGSVIYTPHHFSILRFFSKFSHDMSHNVIIVITLALLLGHFKGKMVLAKSVDRQIKRISSLPNPSSLKHLYSKGYYLLIASMMLLGVLLRYLPITIDTRGAIDCAIGSALINGAMLFFRKVFSHAHKAQDKVN